MGKRTRKSISMSSTRATESGRRRSSCQTLDQQSTMSPLTWHGDNSWNATKSAAGKSPKSPKKPSTKTKRSSASLSPKREMNRSSRVNDLRKLLNESRREASRLSIKIKNEKIKHEEIKQRMKRKIRKLIKERKEAKDVEATPDTTTRTIPQQSQSPLENYYINEM